jgi:hypothetical protein
VNEKNHTQCEIDDDGFQAVRISETKSPEVLASKKGVPKLAWYTIRISIRQDGATFSLQNRNDWELLADVAETGFAGNKFGFYVPSGQQLDLANFEGQSIR